MKKKHQKKCSCSICNNGIREEMQYALLQIAEDQFVILDADEFEILDRFMSAKDKKLAVPEFEKIEPEEDSELVIAYGVLIPQDGSEDKDWSTELLRYLNYGFGTLESEKLYVSAYSDFQLYEEDKFYGRNIPVALLLDTAMDFTVEKDFGFGYSTFLLYEGMNLLDNIINRDFLFCIGGIEKIDEKITEDNWKSFIQKENLMNIAKRLF